MGHSYNRVLLKISGEALAGTKGYGIDPDTANFICDEIIDVKSSGIQIALVVGAGNIFRGISAKGSAIDRVPADHMGMLATVMNALALSEYLTKKGISAKVLSGIPMPEIAETFTSKKAVEYLNDGNIVIFAGGTGNPFFTTDTAAALRASEIGADVIIKATKVDGVYSDDPVKNPDAKKIVNISHIEVLQLGLKVMDTTAISLCMDNKLPIIVFKLLEKGNFKKVINEGNIGTLVSNGGEK